MATAKKKSASRPTRATKPARSKAGTATDVSEDLDAILAESERENETLISVLEQAQRAQRALAAAQKRVKELEHRHEAEHKRETMTLAHERDVAAKALTEAQAAADAAESGLDEAAKAARTLASALVRLGDPLEPLADGDSTKELDKLRDAVKTLSTKDADAEPADVLSQARELVDVLTGRVSQQSNRVKLLRKHVQQLDGDLAKTTRDGDQLRKTISTHEKALADGERELKSVRSTLGSLEKDLAQTGAKLERQTRVSLDTEAKALRERERLTQDHQAAATRADGLAKDIVGLRAQLRVAEHLAADLGSLLIDACDEMDKVEAGEGPSTELAKRELADLVSTLGEASDDDLEAALREDVCEDLLPTGRALAQVLIKRHKHLGERLAMLRRREEAASAKAAKLGEQLDAEKGAHKTVKQDLTRSEAQLRASAKEIERLGKELAERVNDLGVVKGEAARLQAENESLGKQADLARQVKVELDQVRTDMGAAARELEKQRTEGDQWTSGLRSLARALVELAGATESALVAAGLKPEGFIGRFTRSMRKLENDVGASEDISALLKSSLDMAEKAGSRIGQLERELRLRGESLAAAERDRDANARQLAETTADRDATTARLHALEAEAEQLQRDAKRAQELDVALATRDGDLNALRVEHTQASAALKQTRAELEEIRAREAATVEHLGRDLEQTRARLAAEQQARRDQEATLGDTREELDARIAALTARTAELEKSLETREQRLTAVTKELAAASDKAAKASDERKKADQLKARAAKAEERIKALEAELDDARANADAADEVDALRAEREDLARRLRESEKKTADASGAAARATTTAEALKRKLDERQSSHRAEADALQERLDTLAGENRRLKEQLAGLNARVRTLTDAG